MKYSLFVIAFFVMIMHISCNKPFINYPYAENNTATDSYFGITLTDDYQWLQTDPSQSYKKRKWLQAQNKVCNDYFKHKDMHIFDQIDQLSDFPRFIFIRSSNDTLYYAGVYPYSEKLEIYKYMDGQSVLIKTFHQPEKYDSRINALVLEDGRHIALLYGANDSVSDLKNIHIYSLADSSAQPVAVIHHVLNYPLIPGKSGSFFFVRDYFDSEGAALGVNQLFSCKYSYESSRLHFNEKAFYTDLKGQSDYIFDMAYDESNDRFFVGEYSLTAPDSFMVFEAKDGLDHCLFSFTSTHGERYRMVGTDDINIYVIGLEPSFKGRLYALNHQTCRVDTIIYDPTHNIQYFSLNKNGAIVYFRNDRHNKAYFVDKKTLQPREFQLDDKVYYTFAFNKKSDRIFFQRESLIDPKSIYELDPVSLAKCTAICENQCLPFNPADYEIENLTVKSLNGSDINLQISYKKGAVKNGKNPMILVMHVNAENAFMDKFSLIRILYMNYGYIFVQRASTDTEIEINLAKRSEDLYSVYRYMIDSGYSSPGKMAFIGREFGASALLHALNKYPIQSTAILVDGIYDYVKYNNSGKLLFDQQKLFHASDSITFKHILDISPYHQVVSGKNYPPLLLVSTDKANLIPEDHTLRLTARIQMRSKADNPVIMLTPRRVEALDPASEFSYKMVIEHGFIFIATQHGIDLTSND